MNKWLKSINSTNDFCSTPRETCMNEFKDRLDVQLYKECGEFIKRVKESIHEKILDRQKSKFNRLCQQNKGGPSNNNRSGHSNTYDPQEGCTSSPVATAVTTMPSIDKWMKNLSKTPKFAIAARSPLLEEYITTLEQACLSLKPYEAEEIRAEISGGLKHSYTPRSNITKESKALKGTPRGWNRSHLNSWQRWGMDKPQHTSKVLILLDEKTYQDIWCNPTNKYKKKLINLLKNSKEEGGINDTLYKKMYPTGAAAPKFYGLPKTHKRGTSLRPIVSSRGTTMLLSSQSASHRPLVGRSPHHIKNTKDFVDQIHGFHLQEGECVSSFDVWALFTSLPTDPAINIQWRKLEHDPELQLRKSMTVEHIISLLEFCSKTTNLQFQGRFFEQIQDAPMGSPPSPIVAKLYIEEFEIKAINTVECPPRVWKRYVDDTLCGHKNIIQWRVLRTS